MPIPADTERRRAMQKSWAEDKVASAVTGYQWNGRTRKSLVTLPAIAAKLLHQEHDRAVRIVKRLKQKAYFEEDTMDADQFDAYIAALDDVCNSLMKGRR